MAIYLRNALYTCLSSPQGTHLYPQGSHERRSFQYCLIKYAAFTVMKRNPEKILAGMGIKPLTCSQLLEHCTNIAKDKGSINPFSGFLFATAISKSKSKSKLITVSISLAGYI